MKQHINTGELHKLSRDGQNRLLSWWKPKMGDLFTVTREIIWVTKVCRFEQDGFIFEDKWYDPKDEMTHLTWSKYHKDACLPLLNIGQMIEFLDENTKEHDLSIRMGRAASDGFAFPRGTLITHIDGLPISEIEDEPVLGDALWEAVKEVLEAK